MSLFKVFSTSTSTDREEEKVAPSHFDALAVLTAAGVGSEQREKVERAIALLRALVADTPADIGRQIVAASLKAFDISVPAIVEAATAEVAAFDAFLDHGHKQLGEVTKQGQSRVDQLQAEIAKIQKQLEVAKSDQAGLDQAALTASERIRPVLSFFSEPAMISAASEKPASVIVADPARPKR